MPFVKGQSGNPAGRQKGGYSIDALFKAIKRQERKEDRDRFLDHLVIRAYKNDKVLVAVAKKILPDLVDNGGGAAVENILIAMMRKRAELTQAEPKLLDTKTDDIALIENTVSSQEVKPDS